MKHGGLIAVGAMLLGGCSFFKSSAPVGNPVNGKKVTILYESNRNGEMEPCGCQTNPFGGLDREANAVQKIKEKGEMLYVDAGNLYVPGEFKVPIKHFQDKARTISAALGKIGLDAYSPGPNDYKMGLSTLKALAKESKFKFISTNVVDNKNKPVFEPFVVVERAGTKFGILSVTPDLKSKDVKVLPAAASLAKWIPEVRKVSDVVILLSQMDTAKNEEYSRSLEVNVIVGADPEVATEKASWSQKGKTLLVDAGIGGRFLGQLDLNLVVPFKGFYSDEEIASTQEELKLTKASMEKYPENENLKKAMAMLQTEMLLEPIKGGSPYRNELIKLDAERFGAPNEVTELLAQQKEAVRKRALGE